MCTTSGGGGGDDEGDGDSDNGDVGDKMVTYIFGIWHLKPCIWWSFDGYYSLFF